MKLLVDGHEVPILALSACESLDYYYPYYLITVPVRITTNKIVLEDSKKSNYYILRGELNKQVYVYTIVLDSVYRVLNRTYPSYTGTTSLQGLLSTLSIKHEITSSTGQVYWRVPALKFTNLIDYLSKFTVVSTGGAPKFFVDLNGNLQLYDLRQILSRNNPTKISSFGLRNDQEMSDWILRDTGSANINIGSPNGITTEKFVIEDNMGLCSAHVNDTTGYEAQLLKRFLTTKYYTHRYTARRVTIGDGADSLSVGELVEIDGVSKFVVYARSASIPINKEPISVSYILVSSI